MYKGREVTPYEVEQADGAFEVRVYGPFTVVETLEEGSRRASLGPGLRTLAGYLAGGNADGRPVARAVPVEHEPGALKGWLVRCALPAGETPGSLPAPESSAVTLRRTATARLAVVRFSGLPTSRRLARQEWRLRNWAKRRSLPLELTARHLYYDRGLTLPWRRRTEIAVAVK